MRTLIAVCALVLIVCAGMDCVRETPHPVTKRIVLTADAPEPIGPYSQAVQVGRTLYCAGQIAIEPKTGKMVRDSIEAETRQVLENLGAVLRAAGFGYKDVVQATIFMANLDDYARINSVYAEVFKQDFPARCAVQVGRLPKEPGVEIALTAAKTDRHQHMGCWKGRGHALGALFLRSLGREHRCRIRKTLDIRPLSNPSDAFPESVGRLGLYLERSGRCPMG